MVDFEIQTREIFELVRKKDFEKALNKINQLLKKNKNHYFFNVKGSIYVQQSNYYEALKFFKLSIIENKKFPEAHNNIGSVYLTLHKAETAIKHFKTAINIDESFNKARFNLASAYLAVGNVDNAIKELNTLLIFDPSNISAINSLAKIYNSLNKLDKAINLHEKALSFDRSSENFHLLGMDYIYAGEYEKAKKTLEKALPNTYSYYALAQYTSYEFTNEHINLMQNYFQYGPDERQKSACGFALAKVYERKKDFFKSYNLLVEANKIKSQISPFDIKKHYEKINTIKKVFSELSSIKFNFPKSKKKPIFIVGLPRSGTSLIEQIITTNEEIFGAGEIDKLAQLFDKLLSEKKITQANIIKLREDFFSYCDLLTQKTYYVDKTPVNFLYIGLISIIFPESFIIHSKRNLFSVAFSIYQNNFSSSGMNYSFRQDHICDYLKSYKNVMEFWSTKDIPNFIDIEYESLVENYNNGAKEIFNFLEFKNFRDIDHTQNSKPIYTLSAGQARGKVNKLGLEKYKNYGNLLDEFKKMIEII